MEKIDYSLEKEKITPIELANKYEQSIKWVITGNTDYLEQDLNLVYNEKWIYFDKYSLNTLCCLITSKDGYLFLVTADVDNYINSLSNYKFQIVS